METVIDRNKIKITGNGVREPQQRSFDIAVYANVEVDPLSEIGRASCRERV